MAPPSHLAVDPAEAHRLGSRRRTRRMPAARTDHGRGDGADPLQRTAAMARRGQLRRHRSDHVAHGAPSPDRCRPVGATLRPYDRGRQPGSDADRPGHGSRALPVDSGPGRTERTPRCVPLGHPPRARLTHRLDRSGTVEGHRSHILSFAEARSRISSTEAADLLGLSVPYAGKLLAALSDEALLAPSRPNRAGRSFHYVPARSDK